MSSAKLLPCPIILSQHPIKINKYFKQIYQLFFGTFVQTYVFSRVFRLFVFNLHQKFIVLSPIKALFSTKVLLNFAFQSITMQKNHFILLQSPTKPREFLYESTTRLTSVADSTVNIKCSLVILAFSRSLRLSAIYVGTELKITLR